jgi:drug/metabolite transporter (DMT)-like permease
LSWQPPSDRPSGWEPPGQPPQQHQPQQQWQQHPQGGWPPVGGFQPAPPTNGKATTSLVLGICGILLCPLVLSIPALVIGYKARREIDRSSGATGGRGLAVAGIVLGWIGLVFGLLILAFFIFAIAIDPTWLENGDFQVGPGDQID